MTKVCGGCKVEKDICNYGKLRKSLDGYRRGCKDCRKIEQRTRYLKKKEYILTKNQEYEEIAIELKKSEKQIEGIDDERIQSLERRYQIARREKEELLRKIGMTKQKIEIVKEEIKSLIKQYENEIKNIEKHDSVKQRVQFVTDSIKAANEIMTDVKEEIRSEIESKTKEHFFEMIWKKGTYKNIKIDEDYNISVLDQNSMESMGTLSAGERQILALSFTDALHMVSGFGAPIVIDTPLARISGEPKLNFAKALPKYTTDKQIILLMTDQEYTQEVREALKKYVGKEYKILFHETKDGSKAEVNLYEKKT